MKLVSIENMDVVISVPEYQCDVIANAFRLASREAQEPSDGEPYREDLVTLYSSLAMFFEVAGMAAEHNRPSLAERRRKVAQSEIREMHHAADSLAKWHQIKETAGDEAA